MSEEQDVQKQEQHSGEFSEDPFQAEEQEGPQTKEVTPKEQEEPEQDRAVEEIKKETGASHDPFDEQKEEKIDFSKLKGKATSMFTKRKEKKKGAGPELFQDKEQPSFELADTLTYIKKNSKWLIPLVFILIAVLTSTHFRMMSSDLPITDDWAQNTVTNYYQNQFTDRINAQYPNLPQQNRDSLINAEVQKYFDENKEKVAQETAQVSQQYKRNFQDEHGDTYLLAIDPYLWYSEARNVINHGHLGDVMEDGVSKFSLRDGRLNKQTSVQLHPYIAAYLYKFLSFFDRDITIMRALFLLPAILIGLAVIPAFFIGRKFAGNVGGFFAAMLLAVNGPLLGRTPAGFSDTDPYNVLFPLLISWLFIEAYDAKTFKKRVILGVLSGLTVGLYAAAWGGWLSSFLFVLIAIIILIAVRGFQLLRDSKFKLSSKLFKDQKLVHQIHLLIAYFVSSAVFVSVFQSFRLFKISFMKPFKFITLKSVGIETIWPNVLTTVAEFNTQSFSSIISQMGGNLFFLLALAGMTLLLVNRQKMSTFDWWYLSGAGLYYVVMIWLRGNLNDPAIFIGVGVVPLLVGLGKVVYRKENITLLYPVLIAIWFFGTAYAFSKGVRFALLLVPAFAISVGTTLGFLYNHAHKWLTKGIKVDKVTSQVIVFVVLALLLMTPLTTAGNIAKNEIPSMDDSWYNTLTKIKDNTKDAIITSWWDFGHWFVAISERRVTFDGGDQGERIHWVGKSLLTDSETESVGILRMLNCAQETAPHKLDEFTKDSLKSVEIINEVVLLDRNAALKKYQELGLTKEQAGVMIEYTHCDDLIPNYYITSQDMIGKAGVWGHFGSWDFRRATMYSKTNKLSRVEAVTYLTTKFGMSEQQAHKTHTEIQTTKGDQWIAPWPSYLSGMQGCQSIGNSTARCGVQIHRQNVVFDIDLRSMDVVIQGNPDIKPNSIVYATAEGIKRREFSGRTSGFSLIFFNSGGQPSVLVSAPELAASIFTKLFFYDGHGMNCFNKFDDVRQFTGGRIITWDVDYSCGKS